MIAAALTLQNYTKTFLVDNMYMNIAKNYRIIIWQTTLAD